MAAAKVGRSAAGWRLQGHQMEITLIGASGLRLCLAAAAAGRCLQGPSVGECQPTLSMC
jgi:hypothetical protein